jgi:hypothetical protein
MDVAGGDLPGMRLQLLLSAMPVALARVSDWASSCASRMRVLRARDCSAQTGCAREPSGYRRNPIKRHDVK